MNLYPMSREEIQNDIAVYVLLLTLLTGFILRASNCMVFDQAICVLHIMLFYSIF